MSATIDPAIVEPLKVDVKHACRCIFGDGFADHAIDLWEGTPTFDQLNDAVNTLIRAANRVAPEGHRAPEYS